MGESPGNNDHRLTFQQSSNKKNPVTILAKKFLDNSQGKGWEMQPVQQRIQKFDESTLLPVQMKIRSYIFLFLFQIGQ